MMHRATLAIMVVGLLAIGRTSPLFGNSEEEVTEAPTTAEATVNSQEQVSEDIETTVSHEYAITTEESAQRQDQSDEVTVEPSRSTVDENPVYEHHQPSLDSTVDNQERETRSDESTEAPELPTAMAQMMGPIEIRLIDENNTQTHVESAIEPPPLSPITPYKTVDDDDDDDDVTTPTTSHHEEDSHAEQRRDEGAKSIDEQTSINNNVVEYDEKYKKVEYVSDVALNLETSTTATSPSENGNDEETTGANDDVPTTESEPDATLEAITPSPTELIDTTPSLMDQAALEKIKIASLIVDGKRVPDGPFPDALTEEDLPVIEGVDEDDDDPEPVEECLANKHLLAHEIVVRMQQQVERLSRMVRKLGKHQTQFCTQQTEEHSDRSLYTDQFSQCPIWREEKIVHYYKLMRITYCSDYSKWPNGSKITKTYGQFLPLFETLYAFQKQ